MEHWYYMNGAQRVGPVGLPELSACIQSGAVGRSTLVWCEGMDGWAPVSSVPQLSGTQPAAPRTPPTSPSLVSPRAITLPELPPFDADKLRDSAEPAAFGCVCGAAAVALLFVTIWVVATYGAALIFIGLLALAALSARAMAFAHFRVNAVLVSPTQFPQIHAAASRFATRIGQPLPEIYVVQDSIWNAFAARFIGTRFVVLNSALVDSILLKGDYSHLSFIVGHELGHHYSGHLGWRHFLYAWGSWFVWVSLWYSRRREFTSDRYGLACTGSLKAAQRAVCNMAVGAQLAPLVDVREAAQQWEARQDEFFVRYRALYSTHPHVLNRLTALQKAAKELGIPD